MYQQFRSWIVGITTYRTEDTAGHNLVHAPSIRAVHLPPSCLTRFPDCVGLVPNSTATTLRTVKALDTGLYSRSTGHSGSGTNSARMQLSCHYTSYLEFGYQHISVSLPVTYSHRSPLGFYFISRLEDDQLKLPCASCNRRFSFVRIFPSHLGILFSTLFASSVITYPVPVHPASRTYPSCPPAAQFFLTLVPLQAFVMSYLSLSSPRDPVLRPLWSAAACHPLTSLALLSHQSDGFVAASSYTAVSGAAAIVYGLHSPPIISVCAVFPRCASVCVSPLPFLHLQRVCTCLAWTLTAYRRFVSHTYLPTSYLPVRYCVF
jgi:hypothetical protein